MVRIRFLLIGTFCWIALIFAASRADQLPIVGPVTPTFPFYLIAAATLAFLIAYPEYAGKPVQGMLFIVMGVYGFTKVLQNSGQLIEAALIWQTGIEAAMLAVTVYLAREVSKTITSVETSIRRSLLPWNPFTVLNEAEGERVITEEILRARRYERPLTLIHISISKLRKTRFMRWSQQKLLEHEYANLRIIQIIRNVVYESDIIAWQKNDLVVCLPETSREEAEVLAFPLQALLTSSHRDGAKVSMAHFPNDALVYEELLRAAIAAPPMREPKPAIDRLPADALTVLESEHDAAAKFETPDEEAERELVRVRQSA